MKNKIYLTIGKYISVGSMEERLNNMATLKIGDKHVTIKNLKDGLFYSYSYQSGDLCLLVKKRWHYYPALMIEAIRKFLRVQKFLNHFCYN
jgi:hypothetical protein